MDETNLAVTPLARAFRAWMDHARLNPTSLHKRTGISRATIYAVGVADRATDLDTLQRLAAELGTTAGTLVDGIMPPGAVRPDRTLPQQDRERIRVLEERVKAISPVVSSTERLALVFQSLLEFLELSEDQKQSLRVQLSPQIDASPVAR